MARVTINRVNAAIRHLGLQLIRGTGYFYFLSLAGDQVGDSVMVYQLNHLTLQKWVELAELIYEDNTQEAEAHRDRWGNLRETSPGSATV